MKYPRVISSTVLELCHHMKENQLTLTQGVCEVANNPVVNGRVDCDPEIISYKVTIERI